MAILRNAAFATSISTCTAALILGSAPASAQASGRQTYRLPAQSLAESLRAVAIASGRSIIAPSMLVSGKDAPALDGDHTAEEALNALLAGSGLRYRVIATGLIIERDSASRETAQQSDQSEVVVTGSRIRGAPVASPVVRLDQQAIRDAGQSDLGEVARSVPQSYGGGQNPGVGFNVPSSTGGNVGGGSSFNLRGLGSDATLTILNGRRLPYDSARQGVDVSAIPLAAVDRIEIVADGASALYGSDAVGGVVNVVLKRDFDGIETRARIGGSTEGGNFQQQYGAIAGGRWDSGSAFITYEYADNTAISAADRDYAASRPGITLLPASTRHAVTASGHQRLTDALSIEADALYNHRTSATTYPLNFAGNLAASRTTQSFEAESHALAASLRWALDTWRVNLTGSFGESSTAFRGDTFVNGAFASSAGGRYDNRSTTGELSADGPLIALPGGPAKLALGAGVRFNDFALFRGAGAIQNIDASQDIFYAYGELSLPIISPDQQIPLIRHLNLSGAIRYERYRGVAEVVTPKLGIVYSPSDSVDLKATWGRSFRAPSFIQQYQVGQALLYPVTSFGGIGYPSGSSALLRAGGNPALKPEKARSWSATIALHPPSLAGATLELSYFSTRYVDRIVNPILLLSQALSNPIYRDQITLNPTPGQQAALIAGADQFINATGSPYDPARVVAIVDSANINAGRQSIHGVDALLRYRMAVARGSIEMSFNTSYLESEQQLAPAQPVQPLAGRLFNPPHWRARGMVRWDNGPLSIAATVSHIGEVRDTRPATAVRIGGMSTVDISGRYRFANAAGPLAGIELSLSVQNIFDETPTTIATSVYYDTPYDSTNYSPVGRFIAVGLSKKW